MESLDFVETQTSPVSPRIEQTKFFIVHINSKAWGILCIIPDTKVETALAQSEVSVCLFVMISVEDLS